MAVDPTPPEELDPKLSATSEGTGKTAPEAGILGRIIERIGYVFAAAIVLAAIILVFEIFMRYALNKPTLWVHETSIFLCAVSFVYGGLFCASRNSHIRVVLIYDALSPAWRRRFDIVIYLISAGAATFFAWAAWLMVKQAFWTPSGSFRMEGTGTAWNPPTPALIKGFLFLVLIGLALQFLVLAVNHARRHRRGDNRTA